MKQLLLHGAYKLCFILLLTSGGKMYGQIHLKGQKYFEFSGFVTDGINPTLDQSGFGVGAGFGSYNRKENSWVLNLDYLRKGVNVVVNPKNIYNIPIEQFTGSYSYVYKFYRSRTRSVYMNFRTGGLIGYESVNRNVENITDKVTINSKSKFLVGGILGAEIETNGLVFSIRQRYTPTSDTKDFYTQIGVSIRINR